MYTPHIMSLLSGLFGDATEVGSDTLEKELSAFLIEGEGIQNGYKLVRDLIVFTNWRLILVDKQGMTGKKREYTCIPYRSIAYFSLETTGHFDRDAEIRVTVKGKPDPIKLDFRGDSHVMDVFRVLSQHTLVG